MLTHYPTCHANYPEKPTGEEPQHLITLIDDGDMILTCSDCGASVVQRNPNAAPVPESVPKPSTRLLVTVPVLGADAPEYLRRDLIDYLESEWFECGTVTVEVLP